MHKNNKNKKLLEFAYNVEIDKTLKDKVVWLARLESKEEYGGKKFRKTKKYYFYRDLFNNINELDKKLKDLYITQKIIFEYKNSKNKKQITKTEYIIYHLEYFYINIVGIYDRMLHFINFVYELGLSDRFVQKDIILKNSRVDDKMKKFLKEFDKSIKEIRVDQNIIKHKKKFYDKDMYDYELFEMAARSEKNLKTKRQFMALSMNKFIKYQSDLDKYLERNINSVIGKTEHFLKLLEPMVVREDNKFNKK